jgi:hypothetical protein
LSIRLDPDISLGVDLDVMESGLISRELSVLDKVGKLLDRLGKARKVGPVGWGESSSDKAPIEKVPSRQEKLESRSAEHELIKWENVANISLRSIPIYGRSFGGSICGAGGIWPLRQGALVDEMVQKYIAELEGEPVVDDSRFVIDETSKPPPSRR